MSLADITARSRHVRIPLKADIRQRKWHVRYVPQALLLSVCARTFNGRSCDTWHGATLPAAEVERSNSGIETINPVFITLLGMGAHPSNDLLRDIVYS